MKKMLELKKVISIVLICISISIFQGCTSIPECVDKNIGSKLYELEDNTQNKDEMITLNYDEVKDSLIRFHVIANIKEEVSLNGAIGTMMSGSGPTVFAFFDDMLTAQMCYDNMKKKYKDVFITRTI